MTATDSAAPPDYPYCGRGADPSGDPVGCRGHRVLRMPVDGGVGEPELHDGCLAHLTEADRDAYLTALSPGSDLHHRGTTFDAPLLNSLLNAVRDPATGRPRLGRGDFGGAIFEGGAVFYRATFGGDAAFDAASFQGNGRFDGATFQGGGRFDGARFQGDADFRESTFQKHALFRAAAFEQASRVGPVICRGIVDLSAAVFDVAVIIEVTARGLRGRFVI